MTSDDEAKRRAEFEADYQALKRKEWGEWKAISNRKYPAFGKAGRYRSLHSRSMTPIHPRVLKTLK